MRYLWLLPLILAIALLCNCSGLDPKDLNPTRTSTVCDALIGPIKTNTRKPTSKRYLPASSTLLRGDIKQRNQVGENLACPAYAK